MSLFSSLHCAFIVVSTVLVVVSTSRYDNINTAYFLRSTCAFSRRLGKGWLYIVLTQL